MKIGFSTLSCPDWAWSDIYSLAKDFKFDGIEIRGLGERSEEHTSELQSP